jgi:hypothetical protein
LCGLKIAFGDVEQAAFLSGNVPLIKVLREALARNAAERNSTPRGQERHKTDKVLQNVHRFLEYYVTSGHVPSDNVIVFDEAQRAWNKEQATKDTLRRKSHLNKSEAAHALEIMERAEGFGVIIALVGQGQEINTGEAGLAEWGRAISASAKWLGFASHVVTGSDAPEQRLPSEPWLSFEDDLHLSVPIREVRSNSGAPWVEAVLSNNVSLAARIASEAISFPFYLTRNLEDMRLFLRNVCRGQRRSGIVASSGARRLRADGLGVQTDDIESWFLNSWPDIRSSEALETYATEYDCQGLELDSVGLAWGGDFKRREGAWATSQFSGKKWNRVSNQKNQTYILNTYRVLLTRSRYETVIWVPTGSAKGSEFHDATRDASEYDSIALFLSSCGARSLP